MLNFELQDGDTYIIQLYRQGVPMYFIKLKDNNIQAVDKPAFASEFNYYDAIGVLIELEKLNVKAELVIKPGS